MQPQVLSNAHMGEWDVLVKALLRLPRSAAEDLTKFNAQTLLCGAQNHPNLGYSWQRPWLVNSTRGPLPNLLPGIWCQTSASLT
jgi:hypothetical protein